MSSGVRRTSSSEMASAPPADPYPSLYEAIRSVFASQGLMGAVRDPLWESFRHLGIAGLVHPRKAGNEDGYRLHAMQARRPWQGHQSGEQGVLDIFRRLAGRRPLAQIAPEAPSAP